MHAISTRQAGKSRATKRGVSRIAVLLVLVPQLALHAQQIFKSVDVDGHVVYSDHADPSTPQTTVVLSTNAIPPDVLHFCWTNCFTLNLDKGIYRRVDGTDETWTIERFTPDAVILHRHDAPATWNNHSADVTYQGQFVDGRLINATVNGLPVPEINMAWGAALHSVPGSNTERDRRQAAPSEPGVPNVDVVMTSSAEPPPLPDEVQPPAVIDGDLWSPGFWTWSAERYAWVPGAWVRPPLVGLLWTPGYWAYDGGLYVFHAGYWGPHVGYYGGINYGFGYFGAGFVGGRWVGNAFTYNRSVNNLNANVIRNTYDEPVDAKMRSKVGYHGGPHGTTAAPTAQELTAAAERHVPPTSQQHPMARRVPQASGVAMSPVHSANHATPPTALTAQMHPAVDRTESQPPRAAPFTAAKVAVSPRVLRPLHATHPE
jgi:hypothetical protein